jgi:hypothetical protein
MVDDRFDKIGPMLGTVGAEATAIVGGDPDGLYIYAEVEDGSVYAAVFMDEGEAVRYYDPTHELFDQIGKVWDAGDPDEAKRWVVMEYEVRGGKFDTQFKYRGELDPDDYVVDRRRAALKARYGDKPVIYPPRPEPLKPAD